MMALVVASPWAAGAVVANSAVADFGGAASPRPRLVIAPAAAVAKIMQAGAARRKRTIPALWQLVEKFALATKVNEKLTLFLLREQIG